MRAMLPVTRQQLLSASGLALATAIVASGPALRAQSFQATPTATFGSVTINTTPTTTAITVSSPSAVINWTPTDTAATGGPIIFQTSGTTATFTNNPAANSDFAVLNRIIPSGSTRPIQFDGTVVSRLQSAAGGQVPGGTVFFYSPGGILIGASSVFDVGNLVLTTSDLNFDSAGNFDSSGSYVFQPATVAGSQIIVNAGAQLGATADGSYIAMVAPSVTNNGTINVNGSAALVAADAATITFSPSGLFDIQVDSGTSATGTVAANNGTITGPAASGGTFLHRIYMVAVPKNDAITMAINAGSTLGFDIAGAADVSGNTIILSAGHNVNGGDPAIAPSAGGGTGLVSITGGDADITSNFVASATGGVVFGSGTSAGLDFASNVSIDGTGGDNSIFSNAGGSVSIAGDLRISGDVFGTITSPAATAHRAEIYATDGGTMTIGGNVLITANAFGGTAVAPGISGGQATGSFAKIQANNGGQITIAGNATLQADALGGQAQTTGAGGGGATAGTAWVLSTGTGGARVQINGSVDLSAAATGADGLGCVTCTFDGGQGQGGLTAIRAAGDASIAVGGPSTLDSTGRGGNGIAGVNGQGIGGQVSILAGNGTTVSLGAVNAVARGIGGDSASTASSAIGGDISVLAFGSGTGSAMSIGGNLSLIATGLGGSGISPNGAGASAAGGTISVLADGTTLNVSGSIVGDNGASGGTGVSSVGGATGGNASLQARNSGSVLAFSNIVLTANADGGAANGSATAGAGTGGTVRLTADSGTVSTSSGQIGLSAQGSGGLQSGSGVGGTGTGGTVTLSTNGTGVISTPTAVNLSASGIGGGISSSVGSGSGGAGIGGTARLLMDGGQITNGGSLSVTAQGLGGSGGPAAGNGGGGLIDVNISDGTLNQTGIAYFTTAASGGVSTGGGTSGQALGGDINFQSSNSTINLSTTGDATFEVSAYGGGGSPAFARGGNINFAVTASDVATFGTLRLLAEGQGSSGRFGTAGGQGAGGTIVVTSVASALGNALISADTIDMTATGRGGSGTGATVSGIAAGDGGNAQGGSIFLSTSVDGGTISSTSLIAQAAAVAGIGGQGFENASGLARGGNGGAAIGGSVNFTSTAATSGTGTGGYVLTNASVDVGAQGGTGGNGDDNFTVGQSGDGGAATGGAIQMQFDRGGSSLEITGNLNLSAYGQGGSYGTCGPTCVAAGGAGLGGSINFGSGGATSGNVVSIGGTLSASAFGSGGGAFGVNGADGTGGVIIVGLGSGLSFSAAQVDLSAEGIGGDQFSNLVGGAGQGGNASFIASGNSTATVSGTINLYSYGNGGNGRDIGSSGGAGTGGVSRLYSDGGAITVTGGTNIDASGFGGTGSFDSTSGSGGIGTGGDALLTVGTPTAIGNNGNINVGGFTFVTSEGTGGDGFQGGIGTGGFVGISARQGTLTLDSVFATADGFGGYGMLGGNGGGSIGGSIEVVANSAVEGSSLFTINTLSADASASGGFGADAGVPGDFGGSGGAAEGGSILVAGSAGNGTLQVGSASAFASATGGGGGSGGFGGVGGSGIGGAVQIGTISGIDTGTVNSGSATYGTVNAVSVGSGGHGGNGDTLTGTGGAGGNAAAGGVTLLVRGSPTTITGDGNFVAQAVAGNGGLGATLGAGGNATVGNTVSPDQIAGAAMVVTNRVQQPTQRGTLNAGNLSFIGSATGGTGSVVGTSTLIGDAVDIQMINGDFTGTSISLQASAESVTPDSLPEFISMVGSTANLTGGLLFTTPGTFSLSLDQSAFTADHVVISAGNWVLPANAPATVGTLTGTSSINLTSGQDLVGYANLSTQGPLTLLAGGQINLGSLVALGAIDVTAGGTIALADVTSGDSIDLLSPASIVTGAMTAGTSIVVQSGGSVTTGNLSAGTGTPTAGSGELYSIGITSGGNVQTGSIFSASNVGISALGSLVTGSLQSYDSLLLAGNAATIDNLSVINRTLIANASMAALGQSANGFDKELVFAAEPVATGGAVRIINASSSGSLTAAAGGAITAGSLSVSSTLNLSGGGSVSVGQISAGSGTPSATGAGLISVVSDGNVSTGNLTSSGDIRVASGGGLSTGTIVGYDVLLGSVGDTSIAGMNVVNRTLIANSSMSALGQTANGFDKELVFGATPVATGGSVTISSNSNVGSLRIAAGTTVSTANVFAGVRIGVTGNGAMNFGSLQAQTDRLELITRSQSITAASLLSGSDILVSATSALNLGTVRGRDVVLLSGGTVSAQTVLAGPVFSATGQITNAVGRLLIADNSMLPITALPGSINYPAIFAATPIITGSDVTISNVAIANRINIATDGDFSGAGMWAINDIKIEAIGSVTVGRRWLATQVRIVSSDISIIDNGNATLPTGQTILSGIQTSETGFVDLISNSSRTALIGDGLAGSGYSLSNAEIGLVSTGELVIAAVDQAANTTDMLIGNLSLTAGGAIGSSTAAGTAGKVVFASGDLQTETPGGAIRLVGTISGTGFAQSNILEFTTGRFELDAATGSINLTSASQQTAGAALGGVVEINADHIHIASASILDKLAANPLYDGRIAELNAPAAVQRPEGVLRALGLDLYPTGTLYIQNTGTALNPAGFFADIAFSDVTPPANAAAGSLSVVINGAFQTPTGLVSGFAAHDLVVNDPDADFLPFSADSQINGCLLSASVCSVMAEGPDTIGQISGQIEIISNQTLGSTPTFVEEPGAPASEGGSDEEAPPSQQEESSEGEQAASSPIAPAPQLIDSRPLEPQAQVEQPVAGSGNPALIGSVVNENSAEGGDQ
ncbi:hypothetical protein [Novosphingobium taihuense]|uniref:Filamentous hemagglutinin family protein n=1 Tax=Novosphingobium taihuense TaxID=260085 RepID=A0A7W7AGI4_9SPHN|nr:hypothetical protein [Novosphingobium taihuense]MBB4615840.1 hypothetical protein [Novosphingobium taihuense]TWH82931.1 hypothetical protein IQ25_03213 [Novosphingobium taihuense]